MLISLVLKLKWYHAQHYRVIWYLKLQSPVLNLRSVELNQSTCSTHNYVSEWTTRIASTLIILWYDSIYRFLYKICLTLSTIVSQGTVPICSINIIPYNENISVYAFHYSIILRKLYYHIFTTFIQKGITEKGIRSSEELKPAWFNFRPCKNISSKS